MAARRSASRSGLAGGRFVGLLSSEPVGCSIFGHGTSWPELWFGVEHIRSKTTTPSVGEFRYRNGAEVELTAARPAFWRTGATSWLCGLNPPLPLLCANATTSAAVGGTLRMSLSFRQPHGISTWRSPVAI